MQPRSTGRRNTPPRKINQPVNRGAQLTEKRSGTQWPCECPFCQTAGRFTSTENVKGTGITKFICNHCRKSGDAVTMVKELGGHKNMNLSRLITASCLSIELAS